MVETLIVCVLIWGFFDVLAVAMESETVRAVVLVLVVAFVVWTLTLLGGVH